MPRRFREWDSDEPSVPDEMSSWLIRMSSWTQQFEQLQCVLLLPFPALAHTRIRTRAVGGKEAMNSVSARLCASRGYTVEFESRYPSAIFETASRSGSFCRNGYDTEPVATLLAIWPQNRRGDGFGPVQSGPLALARDINEPAALECAGSVN